jgi:hypothetical protein
MLVADLHRSFELQLFPAFLRKIKVIFPACLLYFRPQKSPHWSTKIHARQFSLDSLRRL